MGNSLHVFNIKTEIEILHRQCVQSLICIFHHKMMKLHGRSMSCIYLSDINQIYEKTQFLPVYSIWLCIGSLYLYAQKCVFI